MIQTVLLRTANLSKECQEFYKMNGATHETQIFIDDELYGMAMAGFIIDKNSVYFDELSKEALEAKVRADELLQIERERQAKFNSMVARDERVATIKSWNWPDKLEREFLEVCG